MWKGWFIGNFEPTVFRTKDFEIGILKHKKDEKWAKHYHAIATEYNVLISGKMFISGQVIDAGTIFIFEPNEVADPVFLEDCMVICVKVPSIPGDKYEVF
jgi:hypothetical protein